MVRDRGLSLTLLLIAGCSSEGTATFTVRPGVELATVLGARPGEALTLKDAANRPLLTLLADDAGQAHFAYIPAAHLTVRSGGELPVADGETLKAGDEYLIESEDGSASARFAVLAVEDTPDPALYERQRLTGAAMPLLGAPAEAELEKGFQYIEVRDGVKLGVMVRFPDPDLYPPPWPTVIEYSGYSPSRPSSPEPATMFATYFGYATVGVNMRGTGCSGGVFDVFNPAQWADGYDVVETVARQEWVRHGKVGLVGLSYSGISQLFVAATNPPSLAAITPQSVIADPWEMQWPGGIYNRGFTRQWLDERDRQAKPGGMGWVEQRIAAGDTTCAENLALRSQNIDFEAFLHALEFRPPDAEARSLPRLVERIDVPVYLTGAWQDEQTGALFADMLDRFTRLPDAKKRFTLYNGRHPDGFSPLVASRWFEFLELHVARRIPELNGIVRLGAGAEFAAQFGAPGLGFEPDRFKDLESHAAALAAYEAEPPVRVIFENGAGAAQPGAPVGRFERSYSRWPPAEASPRTLYFAPGGKLTDALPPAEGQDEFRHDPAAGDVTFFGSRGYDLLGPTWEFVWTRFPAGHAVELTTEPLPADVVLSGPALAHLFVKSTTSDPRVQVTLTEVRADGVEWLVQSGWLRLGHRKATPAGAGRLSRSFKKEDFSPVPVGEWVPATVTLPSFAQPLRAGSRLKLTLSSPGRNHGLWAFEAPDYGAEPPTLAIAYGGERPSRLELFELPGVTIPPGAPPCPSLRGQACRQVD